MNNPFEIIDARLSNIENLILDLKRQPVQELSTSPPEKFLTIQDVSKLLCLTVPTLYSKVSKGEIPVMKRGKRLYFSQTELLNFLKEGRRKTNAEIALEAEAYISERKKN